MKSYALTFASRAQQISAKSPSKVLPVLKMRWRKMARHESRVAILGAVRPGKGASTFG